MGSILLAIFTLILVIVCLLLVLVILMQRPSANAGMGAALGGGAAESAFGGDAGNTLTRVTVKLTVLFFVIAAGLYMGYIYIASQKDDTAPTTLSISAVAEKAAKKSAEKNKAEVPAAKAAQAASPAPAKTATPPASPAPAKK